jgi:glutamyl-tRNA synthetase
MVHPARVAVSGKSVGPSLYHMLEVMGKERVLARFDRTVQNLGKVPAVPLASRR